MFLISDAVISGNHLRDEISSPQAGALVTFEGLVRNHNAGKKVLKLEYQAYAELAKTEGEKILDEAIDKFDLLDARCIHRTGELQIEECAVWVACLTGHRGEGFEGCKYIIDEVKKRVPIWKKEFYTDGDTGWIGIDEGCRCGY